MINKMNHVIRVPAGCVVWALGGIPVIVVNDVWVRSATPLALDNKEGIGPHLRESASGLGPQVAAEQANEAASTQQGDFGEIMEQEVYEGLLLAVLAASAKKVKAGLRHTVSSKYQEYPPCTLELGVALDAIDMIVADILHFVEVNAKPL